MYDLQWQVLSASGQRGGRSVSECVGRPHHGDSNGSTLPKDGRQVHTGFLEEGLRFVALNIMVNQAPNPSDGLDMFHMDNTTGSIRNRLALQEQLTLQEYGNTQVLRSGAAARHPSHSRPIREMPSGYLRFWSVSFTVRNCP